MYGGFSSNYSSMYVSGNNSSTNAK